MYQDQGGKHGKIKGKADNITFSKIILLVHIRKQKKEQQWREKKSEV